MVDYTTLTRDWEGHTAVVVGNGTSVERLSPHVHERAGFAHVCVANGGYLTFPGAEVLMCSDRHWLAAHPDLSAFTGKTIIVTQPQAVVNPDPRMLYMHRAFIDRVRGDPLTDPSVLVEGHTSTSTNIAMAVLRGVSKIILLGVDLSPGKDGRRRAGEHRLDNPQAPGRYDRMVRHLTKQAIYVTHHGVRVFNCSPKSKLRVYPYATFDEAMNA